MEDIEPYADHFTDIRTRGPFAAHPPPKISKGNGFLLSTGDKPQVLEIETSLTLGSLLAFLGRLPVNLSPRASAPRSICVVCLPASFFTINPVGGLTIPLALSSSSPYPILDLCVIIWLDSITTYL